MTKKDTLDLLAWKLARNHLDSSLPVFVRTGRGSARRIAEARRQVLDGRQEAWTAASERTILVVGSGASIATFGEKLFPGTRRAEKLINRELKLHQKAMAEIVAQIRRRKDEVLEAYAYADAPHDFETHLAALSEIFTQERVEAFLADTYSERYRPHIVFEIIAHLLRHRFIDVVVNFNFDELLDQAVAAEMGSGEYRHIVSDAECGTLEDYIIDQRLKIPLYIKPHGTASQPSTMRFTKDHYHQLPPPLRRLLANLVAGRWNYPGAVELPAGEGEEETGTGQAAPEEEGGAYPVNLVTIGFGMKSLDLLAMIRDAVSNERTPTSLFHIDLPSKEPEFRAIVRKLNRGGPRIRQHFISLTPRSGGLPGVVQELWKRTADHFHRPFRPRGIARHEIVHALFHAAPRPNGSAGRRVPEELADYFQARLYVELAIALARGNGTIDLALASATRVGVYFDRMWENKNKVSMREILESFPPHPEHRDPTGRLFRMRGLGAETPEKADAKLAADLWRSLRDALTKIGDSEFAAHVASVSGEDMVDRFRRLASSDSKDIDPGFRFSQHILSRTPERERVLHTSLALTLRFLEMLNKDWDVMLVVSDLGKVVDKYRAHCEHAGGSRAMVRHRPEEKEFCVVVTESERPELTEARLKELPGRRLVFDDLPYFALPREIPRQHMVLLLKRRGGALTPVAGISFRKTGLQQRINPVYLDGARETDRRELQDAVLCFRSYVHISVKKHLEERGQTSVPSEEDLWGQVTRRAPRKLRAGAADEGPSTPR